MQKMWPGGEVMQLFTVALLCLITVALSTSIDIPEEQLDQNLGDMEYLALVNMDRQGRQPIVSENFSDIFNKAFARHTLMKIEGLRKVFDHVRGKKSKPPNHHERRVIVGGICCNGKRNDPNLPALDARDVLRNLLKRLRKVTKEETEDLYDNNTESEKLYMF